MLCLTGSEPHARLLAKCEVRSIQKTENGGFMGYIVLPPQKSGMLKS